MQNRFQEMANILFILLLMLARCINTNADTTRQCKSSSVGTNFMIGIIGFRSHYSGTNIRLQITTLIQEPAHVRVRAPFVNLDKTYTVSDYTVLPLNGTLSQYENGTQFKGIEINSDVDISVTVTTGPHDIQEGFLALPVSAIGTRYVVASYYPFYSSRIVVTGVENDTDVFLNAVIDDHQSTNRSFRLQKFETYQYKSVNDVSGSIVTSNKPVAVFSGSAGAKIPVGIGDWQYLIEQMIPTKYWSTKFITPPIYPRRHYVLKFFSDQDRTEVHYYNSTNNFAVFLNKGSVAEFLFGTDPVVVLTNKPISVIKYGHDGDNMIGDPFMTSVQGITQFQNSYKFVTGNYSYNSKEENTIAITILKNSTGGLLLNGHSMSYWNVKNISVSLPLDEYITLFVNVSYNTYYKLHHTSGMEFGAVLYGGLHVNAGYGYPLQLSFYDKDCEKHETCSTSISAHVQTTPATTNSNQTIQEGKGTWCFQCDGMRHLQYCDQVQKCQTKDEKCSNDNSIDGCMECCHGDFCNTAGCGDKGLPAPGQRGPVCFDCTYKGEDEDCTTVKLCHSNQACMVAKYEWGDDDFYYVMGCTDAQVCPTKRSLAEMSKRNVPVCAHCCHSDFCNINCTSGDAIPAIVGNARVKGCYPYSCRNVTHVRSYGSYMTACVRQVRCVS